MTVSGVAPNRTFTYKVGLTPFMYLMRIAAENSAGISPTDEIFVPTQGNQIVKIIEESVVNEYKDEHPWLEETWIYMNTRRFEGVRISDNLRGAAAGAVFISGQTFINTDSMAYPSHVIGEYYSETYVHEMAHIYTLTNDLAARPGPLGIAHLYFVFLAQESDSKHCLEREIYADTLEELVFPRTGVVIDYWSECFPDSRGPTEEAMRVAGTSCEWSDTRLAL